MAKIEFDKTGEKIYETGTKKCVLYRYDPVKKTYGSDDMPGVAWNGISSINESPSGADANEIYADDIKYLTLRAAETFGGTIEAYTYPDEWAECDGSVELSTGIIIGQQKRKTFGLCYRTTIGNDTQGDSYGYKLHLVYGCTASPSERSYQTINDSPEAITFSWEFSTIPVNVTVKNETVSTAIMTLDSTKVDPAKMAAIEDLLYGTGSTAPTLPMPDEVMAIITAP